MWQTELQIVIDYSGAAQHVRPPLSRSNRVQYIPAEFEKKFLSFC